MRWGTEVCRQDYFNKAPLSAFLKRNTMKWYMQNSMEQGINNFWRWVPLRALDMSGVIACRDSTSFAPRNLFSFLLTTVCDQCCWAKFNVLSKNASLILTLRNICQPIESERLGSSFENCVEMQRIDHWLIPPNPCVVVAIIKYTPMYNGIFQQPVLFGAPS